MEALNLAYDKDTQYRGYVHILIKRTSDDVSNLFIEIDNVERFISNLCIKNSSDYYITANTTVYSKRQTEDLFSLNNIVIDIDCHSSFLTNKAIEITLKNFISTLKHEFKDKIPEWNIAHFTGRGLQLWWCFEQVSKSLCFLYKNVRDRIIEEINSCISKNTEFEILTLDRSASKNLVGCYRLFESVNTKVDKQTVVVIENERKYKLQELVDSVTQNLTISNSKDLEKATNTERKTIANTFAKQNWRRIELLENLISDRDSPEGEELRDLFIFIYYNCCKGIYSKELSKAKTKQLNKKFKVPLYDSELKYIFEYVDRKIFLKFKNATIIEFLDITDEEQERYNFKAIKSKFDWSLCIQNKTRDFERYEAKEKRNLLILSLNKTGYTQREIADEVGVSVMTVNRFLQSVTLTKSQKTQKEVQKLKRKGLTQSEVAEKLDICIRTVKTYWN